MDTQDRQNVNLEVSDRRGPSPGKTLGLCGKANRFWHSPRDLWLGPREIRL
jgi:hypothetical protein